MTQTFVHLPVDRVIFGAGALGELPQAVERLGVKRAFIITGRTLATKTEWVSRVQGLLGDRCAGVDGGASRNGSAPPQRRGGSDPFLVTRPVPQIAIPTPLSAGEHTGVFGTTDEGARRKDGAGHPLLVPRAVLLHPQLT